MFEYVNATFAVYVNYVVYTFSIYISTFNIIILLSDILLALNIMCSG